MTILWAVRTLDHAAKKGAVGSPGLVAADFGVGLVAANALSLSFALEVHAPQILGELLAFRGRQAATIAPRIQTQIVSGLMDKRAGDLPAVVGKARSSKSTFRGAGRPAAESGGRSEMHHASTQRSGGPTHGGLCRE